MNEILATCYHDEVSPEQLVSTLIEKEEIRGFIGELQEEGFNAGEIFEQLVEQAADHHDDLSSLISKTTNILNTIFLFGFFK